MAVWKDKKPVNLMSSNCPPTGDTQVRRKQKDESVQLFPCPPSLVAYNQFMAGVDKADQLRGYYKVRYKSRKFYKYIFWFLFDTCVVNTFVLMRNFRPAADNTPKETLKYFCIRLAERLIGEYNSRQRYTLPPSIHEVSVEKSVPPAFKRCRLDSSSTPASEEGHFPIKGPSGRCVYCWNFHNRRRHESTVHCRRCEKALCIISRDPPASGPSCFERFHTECL